MIFSARTLISLLVCVPAASRGAEGFLAPSKPLSPAFVRGGGLTSASSVSSEIAATTASEGETATAPTSTAPSWEDLESSLETIRSQAGEEKKPVLTLYRDTNGWCPFCERVWVAIRAKGLPYQETLVPLQGKPEWYKQMVPTGLVPAVLFHGEEDGDGDAARSSRELVWESDAILRALDDKFPDTVPLMSTTSDQKEAFDAALEMQDRVQEAGFKMAYGNRNGTLTEAEIEQRRADFGAVLDELDAALAEQEGGDFRLGADFSGIDAIMVPTLERWKYQLPLTEDFDILEGRPNLRAWFDRMDSYPAYSGRVAGDEYSWTATASMFLRYFGGGEDKPKVAAGIARADAAAEELAKGFAAAAGSVTDASAALEAAAKLISNHEAVISDCLREEPKSQGHIPRAEASARDTVDALLRHVADRLLQLASEEETESEFSIGDIADSHTAQGALALKTVAKRLCVPRDMGAPSAALLRGVLATVADDLSPIESEEPEYAMEA
eukprot:jgi/Psemu1/221512/e_gw1.1135.3.1